MFNKIIAAIFTIVLIRVVGGLWFHTAVRQAVKKAQADKRDTAAEPTPA